MQKRTPGKDLEVSALGLRCMSMTSAYDLREGRNGQPSLEQIGVAFAQGKGITNDGPEGLEQLRALRRRRSSTDRVWQTCLPQDQLTLTR